MQDCAQLIHAKLTHHVRRVPYSFGDFQNVTEHLVAEIEAVTRKC
jgi:hypothetical protein